MYKALVLFVVATICVLAIADRPDVASTIPDSFVVKIAQKHDMETEQTVYVSKSLNKAKSVQTLKQGDEVTTFTTIADFGQK